MTSRPSELLLELDKLKITDTQEPSYITRLYQLFHVFGPQGILEIGLLYILKGKYYFRSKEIYVNCNGSVYNGRYIIGDLVGRGKDKIEFSTIHNFRIVPYIFPTICPDLFSLLILKLTLRTRERQPLPSYLAVSSAVLISFRKKSLETLIKETRCANTLIYKTHGVRMPTINTYELENDLFRNDVYLPFVNRKAVDEIEAAFVSHLKNLFYKRMRMVKTKNIKENHNLNEGEFKRPKISIENPKLTEENENDCNYHTTITYRLIQHIKNLGPSTFLQICIFVFTNSRNFSLIENNTKINNTFLYIKEKNKYFPIKYFLDGHLEECIKQNINALLPIVQIVISKLGFHSYCFEPLRTPNFMQIPFSWKVDYRNDVLNREAKMFELMSRLHKVYPFNDVNTNKENIQNNGHSSISKEVNVNKEQLYSYTIDNLNKEYNVTIEAQEMKYLEEEALLGMFYKKDNFMYAQNSLYNFNTSLFPQFFEYLGAQGMLEIGLLAASRRHMAFNKGVYITINNAYFKEKFDVMELQKLQLINFNSRKRACSYDKHRITPNKLLDYVPELVALALHKLAPKEDEATLDKNQMLPTFLNFSQTELIEFESKLIVQNIVDRNYAHKYNVNVSNEFLEFYNEKVKDKLYKKTVEDLEEKYIEWYNEMHDGMYEEHNNDYEEEEEFVKEIYFEHPADEPSDDEVIE
eukprot:GAHX01000654.1.p1 GENE.GAHX01000654.1~~GAHX01000654.1.p1  ORF type:complete len:693 (-),score=144.11 GAHX01000654.1:223-2301(-)